MLVYMKNRNLTAREIRFKLSVVTIAKNEEKYIEDFLQAVRWADEIIVVDNGSKDRTIEIAKRYTGKIFSNTESNLGLLKQFALSKATKDWIIVLDVDELVSEALSVEIKNVLSQKTPFDGFSIPYTNFFLGHHMQTKMLEYAKIRLFKRGRGSVAPNPIHEEMIIQGHIGYLKGKILHYSFRSLSQVIKKFIYYAKLESPSLFAKKERTIIQKLTLYPAHMFWAIFVKDEGWRDGIWGFLLALCFAYYEFARYYFLWLYASRQKSS